SVEVFLTRPAFEKHYPAGVGRVGTERVFQATRLRPGRAHAVDPAGEKRLTLIGIQLHCSCDNDHARLLSLLEVDRTSSLISDRPGAAIWLIVEELISRIGAGNRDVREVFAVHRAVAVLLAGWREDDVAFCELVPFLLGFNKALALGHEQ